MDILYCGDSNIEKGVLMSALSLCKNCDENLRVHILTASVGKHKAIPNDFALKLTKTALQFEKQIAVKIYDLSKEFESFLPKANMNTRFTPLCMLRLFADTVDELPEKLLYLDSDVMCRKDFSEFYNTDIGDIEMLGVADRYGKWFFGNVFKHDYLNSGVLLLNMKNIKESNLFYKCRKMCAEKRMFMPDQSALNKLSVKRKTHNKYNEQGKMKNDTVFKHFTTFFSFFPYFHAVTIKPWNKKELHTKLRIFEFDDILEFVEGVYENE